MPAVLETPASHAPAASALRVALVGASLPMRLSSDLGASRSAPPCEVVRVCDSLAEATRGLQDARIDILLIELAEVSDAAVPLIRAARKAAAAHMVVVLYHFGASTTLEQLRMHDCLLAREPAAPSDIIRMCASSMSRQATGAAPARSAAVPPLRFDAAALQAITEAATRVQCECPRHLADILRVVGSFERYSQQCIARHPQDALLHLELAHASGEARALLEQAMDTLARAEGLPLPGDHAGAAQAAAPVP